MTDYENEIPTTEERNQADAVAPEDAVGSRERPEERPEAGNAGDEAAADQEGSAQQPTYPAQNPGPAPQNQPPAGWQQQPAWQAPSYQPGQYGAYAPPQAPAAGSQPVHQYPSYGQAYGQPYRQPAPYAQPYGVPAAPHYGAPYGYRPPRQKLPTALKVFLFVLSVLVVGSLLGLGIATAYAGSTGGTGSGLYQYGGGIEEYFGGGKGDGEGNGTPPGYGELPQVQERPELEQPDIEVTPYEKGISITQKPSGGELTAQQVYDKVVPSTVSILAEIPMTDGTTESSGGTGIFLTSDGFIITNSHVVGNTKSSLVTITTHDGEEYPAVVVGFDKTTDIAILKTEDHGFTPAEFGSSDELSIGEWVIAIGNPGGQSFSGSLTRGVISGLDRTVGSYSSNGMTYIQTDAAINPGNSGGPLVNMYGQVIGINSSKVVAQYYEGMGFAIPVSKAKGIIDQLLSEGYVKGRTRLGITAQSIPYGETTGVLIVNIDEQSSFQGTKAKAGDVITKVEDTEIGSLAALSNKLLEYQPGNQVKVTLYRSETGEELEVEITLLADEGETQR